MKEYQLRVCIMFSFTVIFSHIVLNIKASNPLYHSKIEPNLTIITNTNMILANPLRFGIYTKSNSKQEASAVVDAKYSYPGVMPFNGLANYLSFNFINKDYLHFPKDSVVFYADATINSPTKFAWSAPGTAVKTAESQDLETTYPVNGNYEFPTLTTTTSNGMSSYKASRTIKIGGKAEISNFNSLSLGITYSPFAGQWTSDKGFISGSNGWDDLGFGSLFFLGQQSATISAVSVYLRPKPTAANKDNKVKLTIYETGKDINGYFVPNLKPLATSELKVSEMLAGSSAYTGIKYTNGKEAMGLANFKFPIPVKVGEIFFVSVENFGNDLAAGDSLCVIMNTNDPIPTDSFTTVGSNSSWVLAKSTSGSHSWFTLHSRFKFNPVLMICPVVDFSSFESGLSTSAIKSTVITSGNKGVTILGGKIGDGISVYTITGQKVLISSVTSENQTVNGLTLGVYVAKVGNVVQKILVSR